MKFVLLLLTALISVPSFAQDTVATKHGSLIVRPVLHGTLVLQWQDKTIYVDPTGGAEAFAEIGSPDRPPDLILITDIHGDHLQPATLKAIRTGEAEIIVPKAVYDRLPDAFRAKAVILGNGEETTREGITIRALPMYNLPETSDSRHPKGRGNGYLLTIDNKRIYVSGDTEDIPEMRALEDIDIAFVCMNLPYTMSVEQAADAVLEFAPGIVYPYHYRGQGGLSDVAKFREMVNAENDRIDVRLRDWYPEVD